MKRLLLASLLVTAAGAFAAGHLGTSHKGPSERLDNASRDGERTDSLFFFEDFENGLNGWTSIDITAVQPAWHIDATGGFDGNSWWSGDATIGGYDNHWLHYLETPTIDLTGTTAPTMSFQINHWVEAPGGEPAGYNAWDGGNVWVSVDGGDWTVLDGFTGYPYNATSLYSFGLEFGMGTGIAGWVGNSSGWHAAAKDLSSYTGSTVQFRFAFCSDPGASTVDGGNVDWFGFRVDDILIMDGNTTLLSNNADDAPVPSEFTLVNGEEASGDWWELTTDYSHSPTTAARCSVFPNLRDGLTTPWITLPENWEYWFQWWLISDLRDFAGSGGTNLEDYYRVEVQVQGSIEWTYLLHDYSDVGRPGFNVDENNLAWDQYDPLLDPFNDGTASLTPYAGETIRLRFVVITDDNDDGGTGAGLIIDDFQIWGSNVLANDLGVTGVWGSWPRTQGVPMDVGVDLRNYGSNAAQQVLTWVDVNGNHVGFINPRLDVAPLSSASGQIQFTPSMSGDINVRSYAVFGDDQNAVNDTSYADWTLGTSPDLTFGYYYHGDEIATIFFVEPGEGPFCYFDLAENFGAGDISLDTITAVLGDNNTPHNGHSVVIHIYADNGGTPGAELHNQTINLTNVQTGAVLYEWALSTPVTVSGACWIWLEMPDGFPDAIGHDLVWNGGHYGISDGTSWDLDWSTPAGQDASLYLFASGSSTGTDVVVGPSRPASFELSEAYPNPFNPSTRIDFRGPAGQETSLKVFNLMGEEVATLFSGTTDGASQSVSFDASSLSSGVYFTRLVSGQHEATRKLLLVK
ncbi:MAG: T9SS type A sorting domain-containing protein [Candidatus Cloacimonetes bacterium]|nr:T9SS type A sorting domain-containing protein [Candidatus Cloacimonadota bacterium]